MAKRKRDISGGAGAAKALKRGVNESASTPAKPAQKEHPGSRDRDLENGAAVTAAEADSKASTTANGSESTTTTTTIQIITGSYERALHGFTAAIPQRLLTGRGDASAAAIDEEEPKVTFSDTFLFNAHTSAIRCLALSPPNDEARRITLATGSTDERINLYSLSTAPPVPSQAKVQLPSLHGTSISENSKNKELGSLLHHASSITALCFPNRGKILSSAEDSTIAITRVRDWTALSIIKAPIPTPHGRPSGDTAAPGEVPAGINDFAVHPSMKLMVSVSKGEKCMRLWNLVTARKAGVLNFGKNILTAVGEGRFGSGEGRRVVWDTEGEEFAVAFERGVVMFGLDSVPTAKIVPTPKTKIHQLHYLSDSLRPSTLLVSTEDGRVLLYDTTSTTPSTSEDSKHADIPSCKLIAQIGGPATGITGRIKDFELLAGSNKDTNGSFVITGSSDGTVRIWFIDVKQLKETSEEQSEEGLTARQLGQLVGTYSTGTRITCLKAFVMTGKPEEVAHVIEENGKKVEESSSSEDNSE
ncbi:WD40-repeat-containing domain protein [Massariosphaeria phaeospora]|uniref:WD40-repeat-containing domain protein n=1 Tax=Massariosphaeria phaeospora TaxID=100035 RepID=A0A7C8ICW9_9PLEO|nr:WD40-repeat-containing domain protein [Massariosphaeria phaeospora]